MDDLKIIKAKYGEKMMHLCRELFPSILEFPGVLSDKLLSHFEPSKYLYDDILSSDKISDFQNFILSLIEEDNKEEIVTDESPEQLLSNAGYQLYECLTVEDIQDFKKYYAPGEKLCTFRDERLNNWYVFFAVKKNVDEIKREDFSAPEREDEYGTSVISIQFKKGKNNILSIKNRYNHTVWNPDNTFYNNLDNIIPGLSYSFRKTYNLRFEIKKGNFELPNYVWVDDKYYRYNYEIINIYYCPNNIIIDNFKIIDKYSKEPERYVVFDYFIIDLKDKKIELYDKKYSDSFCDEFRNIESITISKDKKSNYKNIEILYDGGKSAIIVINEFNKIVSYHNNFLTELDRGCLNCVSDLTWLELQSLIKMGDKCFFQVNSLEKIVAPSLIEMGNFCFFHVRNLLSIELPNLTKLGNQCFRYINRVTSIKLPNLVKIGYFCFGEGEELVNLEVPNLNEMAMGNFMDCVYDKLENVDLPFFKLVSGVYSIVINDFVTSSELTCNVIEWVEEVNKIILQNRSGKSYVKKKNI